MADEELLPAVVFEGHAGHGSQRHVSSPPPVDRVDVVRRVNRPQRHFDLVGVRLVEVLAAAPRRQHPAIIGQALTEEGERPRLVRDEDGVLGRRSRHHTAASATEICYYFMVQKGPFLSVSTVFFIGFDPF